MGSKRRRATSPSSSVSGGDFEDSQTTSIPSTSRKRRRTTNIPTVDPVSSLSSVMAPLFLLSLQMLLVVVCHSLSFIPHRLLCVTSCTTLSETIRTIRAGCCVNSSSEHQREGQSHINLINQNSVMDNPGHASRQEPAGLL